MGDGFEGSSSFGVKVRDVMGVLEETVKTP